MKGGGVILLNGINKKLYLSILTLNVIPLFYTTIRLFWLGQLPDEWGVNVASQFIFISIILEVLEEALILPLYAVFKDNLKHMWETGLRVVGGIYFIFACFMLLFAPLLVKSIGLEAANQSAVVDYVRLEVIGLLFAGCNKYILTTLTSSQSNKAIYCFAALQAVLVLCFDFVLFSSFAPINFGVNGIAISNITVQLLLFIGMMTLIKVKNIIPEQTKDNNQIWIKEWIRSGFYSGATSFINNAFYFYMIVRMMNTVQSQGYYWTANNFIWGVLLLPILALGSVVKSERSKLGNKFNMKPYTSLTALILGCWMISIPLWKPFLQNIYLCDEPDLVFHLLLLLTPFYVLFSFNNLWDSYFYSTGRTENMLIQSIVVHSIIYVPAFFLYFFNIWAPTLTTIAVLFGSGILADSIVSYLLYRRVLKIERSNVNTNPSA